MLHGRIFSHQWRQRGGEMCIHWESICSQQKHTASHQHWTCLYDPCVWHQGEPHTFSMKWESEWCLSEKVNYWILSKKATKRSREQRRHLRLTATVTTLGVNLQPHNLQGHFSIAEERNSRGGGWGGLNKSLSCISHTLQHRNIVSGSVFTQCCPPGGKQSLSFYC